MCQLSVNINKVATLRNARGGLVPNVVKFAKDCESYGAQGITVHPRPDERHIKRMDVFDLAKIVSTEFNIEGYPTTEFIDLVVSVGPKQVTLVPDPPEVLTSNAGWNVIEHEAFLKNVIAVFHKSGIRVSLFMENENDQIKAAKDVGANRIELYTEDYASNYSANREEAIAPYVRSAELAQELGLGLNAGHDLSLENLEYFFQKIPSLLEVSIGHALISDALYYGIENTIQMYLNKLR